MVPIPHLNERDLGLVVAHSIGTDESVDRAVVAAFLEVNIDVFERETTLEEWVDTDALGAFDWCSGRPFYVSTPVWGYQVVVTPDEVRIYPETPVR
jgi:hypothetical protein